MVITDVSVSVVVWFSVWCGYRCKCLCSGVVITYVCSGVSVSVVITDVSVSVVVWL